MESPDAVGKASHHGRAPYVTIYLKFDGDVVAEAMFQSFGCGAAIASCSMLTEMVKERSREQCSSISAGDLIRALQGMPPDKEFCAELAVAALKNALGCG